MNSFSGCSRMYTGNTANVPKFKILTEKVASGKQNLSQETPALYKYYISFYISLYKFLGYPLSRMLL